MVKWNQLFLIDGMESSCARGAPAHNPQPNQLPLNRPTNQFHFVQLFDWLLFIGVEWLCELIKKDIITILK